MQTSFQSKGETLSATLYANVTGGLHSTNCGVVLCPPHPLYGGTRNDTRLVRIAKKLAEHNITALCFDYGSYGKGIKEVHHTLDAIAFMRKQVTPVGLLGYSFGAVVASNAAAHSDIRGFVAMSTLRTVNGLTATFEADCAKLFIHGKRDAVAPFADFKHLYREAKGKKEKLVLDTDHFYMDNHPMTIDSVSEAIRKFFENELIT